MNRSWWQLRNCLWSLDSSFRPHGLFRQRLHHRTVVSSDRSLLWRWPDSVYTAMRSAAVNSHVLPPLLHAPDSRIQQNPDTQVSEGFGGRGAWRLGGRPGVKVSCASWRASCGQA